MIKEIKHDGKIISIIIKSHYSDQGIKFVTPDDFPLQMAFMKHPSGKVIQPHVHNPLRREVSFTQEVLFLRKGQLRVDFYTDDQEYIESYLLEAGDVILLSEGGHGFEVLEEVEMIEVKQGPYTAEMDKIRFKGNNGNKKIIK